MLTILSNTSTLASPNPITSALLETLRFINDYTETHHYPPLYSEMCRHLRLASKSIAKWRVDSLRSRGLLTYKARSPRSIVLTETGRELAQ